MTKTQRKRLLCLADFIVEKVPAHKFYMGRYGTLWGRPLDECGSPGCAIGWCCTLFKRVGVIISSSGLPTFREEDGINIAVPLFGLTNEQAHQLFTGSGNNAWKSAEQVRRQIITLVNKIDKTQ